MYAEHCYQKKHNIDLSSDPMTRMNGYIYGIKATQSSIYSSESMISSFGLVFLYSS